MLSVAGVSNHQLKPFQFDGWMVQKLVAKQDFLTSRWRDGIIVGRQSTKPTNYKAPKAKPEKQLWTQPGRKKRWRLGFDSPSNHWVASKKPWPLRFYRQFGMVKKGRSFFLTQAFKAYSRLEKSIRISMHYIVQPQENYKIFLMHDKKPRRLKWVVRKNYGGWNFMSSDEKRTPLFQSPKELMMALVVWKWLNF